MVRVLTAAGYYWPATEWGGPVRSVRLLARAAARAGVAMEVVTTNARGSPGQPRAPAGAAEVDGIRVHYCESAGPRRYFFSKDLIAFLYSHIREFDVVHIQGMWIFPSLLAGRWASWAGVPYILSPRGSLDPWALAQKWAKKQLYLSLLERRTLLSAKMLHFTSASERDAVPAEFARIPSAVIPNAVELGPLLSLERAPQTNPSELLVLGRLHPMKGFDVLIPALARARESIPGLVLKVAGPDEDGYGSVIRELAGRFGVADGVELIGMVDDAERNRLLSRARLLVQVSYRENFGMAVAEAMAAGVPVVVSENVNICDDIRKAGAGVVVPMDVEQIARAIVEVVRNPAQAARMGRSGKALVVDRYGEEAVGLAMKELYERIAGAFPRRNFR